MTLVGTRANFSQARRVVSRSCSRKAGFLRKAALEWRFMKGKSSAHQASPITGTKKSCCLMKNLSIGMRRFITCCNAKMSTAPWWLQFTRYQPR